MTASTATKVAENDRPIIIRVRDLKKIYDPGTPRETRALKGVDLDVSLGEIVIIFGPSGSGKSTLLNILAGLDRPTDGLIEIDKKDLLTMSQKDLALFHQFKVGMVFQAYNLVGTFTVLQNITMPARLAGFSKKEYLARGLDLLKQFELEQLTHKLPGECSGGQQQRVGIMRAFMNRPSFIIADEPTGNLDSASSEQIMKLFQNLNHETNTTMVIVTHDPSLFAIADRVVHVLDGNIVKQTLLSLRAKVSGDNKVPVEHKESAEDRDDFISAYTGKRLHPKKEQQSKEIELARTIETQNQEKAKLLEEEQQFQKKAQQQTQELQAMQKERQVQEKKTKELQETTIQQDQELQALREQAQEAEQKQRALQEQEQRLQQLLQEREQTLREVSDELKAEQEKQRTLEEKKKARHKAAPVYSALQQLIASRDSFSALHQYILESLTTILSSAQQRTMKEETILLIVDAIGERLSGSYNQSELQEQLDRSMSDGGVGLRRETAEHIASSVELMIRLGKLKPL